MPGPAGTQAAQEAYQARQSVNNNQFQSSGVETGNRHHFGSGVASGAGIGAGFGGWQGALVGGGIGLISDVINMFRDRKAEDRANKNARDAAAAANAEARANEENARKYNSESSQIQRFQKAGLSPGLMYGQMSSSSGTASPVEAAQTYMQNPSNMRGSAGLDAVNTYIAAQLAESSITSSNFDNALKDAQAKNLDSQTTSNDISNRTLAQRNALDLGQIAANIQQLLSQSNLNEQQRKNLEETLDSVIKLNEANANAANANADYTSGALTDKTNQDVNVGKSQVNLNNAQARYTSGALTNKTNQDTATSLSQQHLNEQNEASIKQQYDITQTKVDRVKRWLKAHGFSEDDLGLVFEFADGVAKQSGRDLSTTTFGTIKYWLTTAFDNWRKRVSDEKIAQGHDETSERNNIRTNETNERNNIRTNEQSDRNSRRWSDVMFSLEDQREAHQNEIAQFYSQEKEKDRAFQNRQDSLRHQRTLERDSIFRSPTAPSSAPPDAVKSYPSKENFQKEMQRRSSEMSDSVKKRYNDYVLHVYPKLDARKQALFRQDMYYSNDFDATLRKWENMRK